MRKIKDDKKHSSPAIDSGFGIIEIVISMFLLALLAIAFLPMLITSLSSTAANATAATATQIVNQQLEQARASGSSCSAVKSFAAASVPAVAQPRGALQPHRALDLPVGDVCTSPYLRTVLLRVWVTGATGAPISEAPTLILLDAP